MRSPLPNYNLTHYLVIQTNDEYSRVWAWLAAPACCPRWLLGWRWTATVGCDPCCPRCPPLLTLWLKWHREKGRYRIYNLWFKNNMIYNFNLSTSVYTVDFILYMYRYWECNWFGLSCYFSAFSSATLCQNLRFDATWFFKSHFLPRLFL